MGIIKRILTLWRLSSYEVPPIESGNTSTVLPFIKQHAEFILPDRTKEIFERKSDATLDDVIV